MNPIDLSAYPTFAELLRATMDRLGLDEVRIAEYLGTAPSTVRHWLAGTRSPSSATWRLLYILRALEIAAPDVHAQFVPHQPERVGKHAGRPKKVTA